MKEISDISSIQFRLALKFIYNI